MKKLEIQQMVQFEGGKLTANKINGCGLMGVAAMWGASPLGPGALGVGLLTYAGCLLIESD